ncbi:MAG: hypothetical protein VX777_10525 [Chlamydiota bacterium]|nr:hypothetical protein [Chlamydiota bacterium]
MNNIFYYIINFIVALLFILVGAVCITLPWSPDVRLAISLLINESTMMLFLFGLGLMIIGLAVITYVIMSSKRRTYFVRKGRCSIGVNDKVLDQYVHAYINDLFPDQEASHHLILKKDKIILTLDVPFMPKPEQEPLTEQIFEDITAILIEKIGYNEDLHLTVGFQPPTMELEA